MGDVLQKCAKNAQVQNNPALKWGTCHNGEYAVASKIIIHLNIWSSKQHLNQNGDTLWAICVYAITRAGWVPIGLLVLH
jgi:hypothetical protein